MIFFLNIFIDSLRLGRKNKIALTLFGTTMPRIFDNIDLKLETALKESLELSHRADFCVGYFNLRGWHNISDYIDRFEGGEGKNCRLLIGMQKTPVELLSEL